MFWKLVIIFFGGGIGALLRYGASILAGKLFSSSIPGTFAVNILGCLALGAFYGGAQARLADLSEETRLFVAVGLLGALTTFSTFNWELFSFIRSGRHSLALFYLFGSCALGLLATGIGYWLTTAK